MDQDGSRKRVGFSFETKGSRLVEPEEEPVPNRIPSMSTRVISEEPFMFETGSKLNESEESRFSDLFTRNLNFANLTRSSNLSRNSNLSTQEPFLLGQHSEHRGSDTRSSNLSLVDSFVLGANSNGCEEAEQRLSNLSVQESFILGPRSTSDREARGSELWHNYPLKEVKLCREPRGSDIWKGLSDISNEEMKEFYIAEFARTDRWKKRYQRNNRNGGLKNIRCFPRCGRSHFSKGFCGESVALMLLTNRADAEFFSIAEFGLAVESAENKIKVGDIIDNITLSAKLKTQDNLFNPWWAGDIVEKQVEKVSLQKTIIFEFSTMKRGWHYGWVANKHISQLRHCMRAYVFILSDKSQRLKCVATARSPDFVIYTRKSRPEDMDRASLIPLAEAFDKSITSIFELTQEQSIDDHAKELLLSRLFKLLKLFRFLSAVSRLPPEAFNGPFASTLQSAERKMDVLEGVSHQEENLRAFSRYLVSEEESLTMAIMSILEKIRETPHEGISKYEIIVAFVSVVKDIFDSHLKAFNLSTDTFPSPAKLAGEHDESDKESEDLSEEEKYEYLVIAENIVHFQFGCTTEQISADYQSDVMHKTQVVMKFIGSWARSDLSIRALERIYSMMGVPIALRTCLVFMNSSIFMEHCDSSKTLLVRLKQKLFCSGVIRYMYDSKAHNWTLASPLAVPTKHQCKNYMVSINVHAEILLIEHFYDEHKIQWTWKCNQSENISGMVKLYERTIDNPEEWVLLAQFEDMLTRVG